MNQYRFTFGIFDPFHGFLAFLQGPRLCLGGLFNKSSKSSSTSVSNNQTSIDASASGAGATTFTASQNSAQDFDFSTGQTTGSTGLGNVTGSENLILGTGADYTYVEQLSDDIVMRALETVDATNGNAARALQGSVAVSDAAARRSAEFADAARLTIERVADPAGSASRTILYVVAALAAVALFLFRPRKSKA